MKRYGVVMAGGGGTRFWPLSRAERPKQLLNLSGKDLMVNETLERLTGCMERDDLFIVTNVTQAPLMAEETEGRMQKDHILAEPAARNTSACIGYAAMEIVKKYGDGIMVIVPSDHFIKDTKGFSDTIDAAIKAAEETDALITIGIEPTYPATGYGYIRAEEESEKEIAGGHGKKSHKVAEFVEKPALDVAKEYVAAGNYYWNSGMFVWKASTILSYMEKLLPDVYACLDKIGNALGTDKEQQILDEVYPTIPKISIDYGIMERADNILVIPSSFGWNDIGSLDMLSLMKEADESGNASYGETLLLDTKDSIVYGTDKLIATIGLKDMIVVQAKDAILICPKDRAQEVKDVVETLKAEGRDSYL
ncbi:MAG: mannose-1-phosphate guanylyltransferase [Lachnospiraceae bacterium]|nr:mannose-1-phosphate guanylyltransferase [Lachnospiraceae bacterium]